MSTIRIAALLLLVMLLSACRGKPFEEPPRFVQPNMHYQEKFTYQSENRFFEDGRADRLPVEGTIARGRLAVDVALHEGRDENGNFVTEIPLDVSRSFLMRGGERYYIYCTPCHGNAGDGMGIISQHGLIAPSFHTERIREMPYGEIYSAIYNGINTMGSYRHQLDVEDRWAVVAYVRALQLSQNATEQDVRALGLDPNQIRAQAAE